MSRYQSEIREMMLIEKYPPPINGKVLDLCCGSGQYRAYFKNQEYIGVDKFDNNFSQKESENVKFVVEDAENLSFDNEYFDYVFCCAGLEHVRDNKKVTEEMVRVMKNGSYAYVSVPSKVSNIYSLPRYLFCLFTGQKYYGHGHHYYSKKELRSLMVEYGLEVIGFYPETGFLALCWITISKWSSTIVSISSAIFKKITRGKRNTTNASSKKTDNNITDNSDPRDDHGEKIDFSHDIGDIKNSQSGYYKEYGIIRKFFAKLFWLLDYLFPIPIVAGWIVIVKKR